MSGGGELCFALNHLTTITCWRLSHFPSRGNAVWVWKYVVDVTTLFQKYSEDFGLGGGSALSMENLYMILEKLGGRPNTTNCFPMSGLNGRVSCRLSTDCKNHRGGSQPYSLKTFWNFSAFQNPTVGAEGLW